MTISAEHQGMVLFFSHEELCAACPAHSRLSDDDILPLIRSALFDARQPVPRYMEIQSYPSRQGVLFFILPKLDRRKPRSAAVSGLS